MRIYDAWTHVMTSRLLAGIASFGFVIALWGCSAAPDPVVAEPPGVTGPPNIVLIVADDSAVSSAFAHSALLLGVHPGAPGANRDADTVARVPSPPVGVRVFPEYLRRAGYYTVRSGDALHTLAIESSDAEPLGGLGQPGLLGAWDTAGPDADWRKGPGDPCTVNFGCGGYEAETGLPFFALFNLSGGDEADHIVKRILTELEAEELAEDTVVLAFHLNINGGDASAVLRWPEAEASRDDPISVLDVAPTILSLAGVPVPSHMQGRVIVGQEGALLSGSDERVSHSTDHSSSNGWVNPSLAVAATPSGYPRGGLFHVAPRVELSCETEDSSIIYTTEREPPYHWRLYTGPFRMRFWTLRFQCGRLGYLDSEVVTYDFDIE